MYSWGISGAYLIIILRMTKPTRCGTSVSVPIEYIHALLLQIHPCRYIDVTVIVVVRVANKEHVGRVDIAKASSSCKSAHPMWVRVASRCFVA